MLYRVGRLVGHLKMVDGVASNCDMSTSMMIFFFLALFFDLALALTLDAMCCVGYFSCGMLAPISIGSIVSSSTGSGLTFFLSVGGAFLCVIQALTKDS